MPVEEKDAKLKEAYDIGDMIHGAASLVEQAIKNDDPESKKALRAAAKALLNQAVARMDESVGAEIEDED